MTPSKRKFVIFSSETLIEFKLVGVHFPSVYYVSPFRNSNQSRYCAFFIQIGKYSEEFIQKSS